MYSSGTTIWHIIEALYYVYILWNKLDFFTHSHTFHYNIIHMTTNRLFRPNPFQAAVWTWADFDVCLYNVFVVSLTFLMIKSQGWSQLHFLLKRCVARWYLLYSPPSPWKHALLSVDTYWWKMPNVIRGTIAMSNAETWVTLAPLQFSVSQVQTYVLYSSITVL